MSPASNVTISAARTDSGFTVRIEGRGTMRESVAFHQFGLQCLEGESCEMLVDLSHCEYLDSTFLGCLLGLHKRFRRSEAGSFMIAAGEECWQRLLAPLQLHKVFTIIDTAPEPISQWRTLYSETADPRNLGQHVLECHCRLVELGGANQDVFAPIVQRLADELDELKQQESEAPACEPANASG